MKVVWPKRTLGSICEFVRGPFGGSLKKSEFVSDGFAVYEQQHAIYNQFESIRYFITDSKFKEMQRFELCPNDLIMSCSGTMGRVAIVPNHIRKGIINQALLKLTPSNAVVPEFLKYWMDSAVFQTSLIEQSGGAAIQNVASVRILKDINIFLPPLSEQQRIVAILDEAFEAIAAARVNAEQNRQNAQALFESYLQSVFSQRGEGWVDTTIAAATGGVFTGPFGSLLHKSDYIEHGIPLVNPAHITSVGIEPDLRKTVSEETAQRLSNYIMRAGDIVIGRRGEMGRCAIVTDIEDGWLCGTGSFVIKPSERCDARYLVRLLRSESCKTQLENIAGGAVMPNLSNTDLSNFPIILPPIDMQRSVLRKIDLMAEKTQHLESLYQRKIAALDELKQSLLQQAFSGQL